MALRAGASLANKVYAGAAEALKVYQGSVLVHDGGTVEPPVFNGKKNSFIGIPSGTAVTPANSGGASGDAFSAVSGSVIVQSSADLTAAHDRGVVTALAGTTNSYAEWTLPTPAVAGSARRYFRMSALPTVNQRIIRGVTGSTVNWEVRVTATGQCLLANQAGEWVEAMTGVMSINTIYRIEVVIISNEAHLYVYEGESTTPLPVAVYNPYGGQTWAAIRFGLMTSSASTYSVEGAAFAWSPDAELIGPEAA